MAHYDTKTATDVILIAYNALVGDLEHRINWGNDASKPASPSTGDRYVALDTKIVYFCYSAGSWEKIIKVTNLQNGTDAGKSATPDVGDVYVATDTNKLYFCSTDDSWTDVQDHTPKAHKASHENTGGDEISIASLSGEAADVQKSKCMILTFFIPTADITVGENKTYEIYAPCGLTIDKVYIHAKVAPGAEKTVTIDVNKGGTTVFTTQGGRPTITGAGLADESDTPDVTAVSKNDIISVDIDVATADHSAEDITVQVRCVQT